MIQLDDFGLLDFEVKYENAKYSKERRFKKNNENVPSNILFEQYQFIIKLKQIQIVEHLVIKEFKHSCTLSVLITDDMQNPFIEMISKKQFDRTNKLKINISYMPCKYILVKVHKGVYLDYKQIQVVGRNIKEEELDLKDLLYLKHC